MIPDATTCVHCGKLLDKQKEAIVWVSHGIKTPACLACSQIQKLIEEKK